MKKIVLILALVAGIISSGVAQNLEKALKGKKWYSNGDMGAELIILTKTNLVKSPFDVEFKGNNAMTYCYIVKSALLDPQGNEVKAGEHYCDPLYTYEIKGDILNFKYPLVNWYYKIKMLKNGDLELTQVTNVK
jgi:hypothetical protein